MKALILAAGRGRRLKPITYSIPKTLIKIEDKPILGHILSSIKACGIKDVVIVTGYKNNLIKEYVGDGSKWGLNVVYRYNRKYKTTENIYSVRLAADELLDDDFVLINADDLFSPVILKKLIQARGDVVLAVDSEGTLGSEEMKVSVDENGRIIGVSKRLDPIESLGEDIGVMKFSKEGGRVFLDTIDDIIENKGPHFYFQEALDHLSNQRYPITYVDVKGEPWIEIDDHFDLKWAKTPIVQMILDRIRSFGRRLKRIRKKS